MATPTAPTNNPLVIHCQGHQSSLETLLILAEGMTPEEKGLENKKITEAYSHSNALNNVHCEARVELADGGLKFVNVAKYVLATLQGIHERLKSRKGYYQEMLVLAKIEKECQALSAAVSQFDATLKKELDAPEADSRATGLQ